MIHFSTSIVRFLACLLLVTSAEASNPLEGYEVVDLTHTLNSRFPYIPVPGVTFPFALEPIATIHANGVAANRWQVHEHLGTQIDAPNHFVEGGSGLESLQADNLVVPMVVIDYRDSAAADVDAQISTAQILQWEARYGRIPMGAVVMLYTGWDRRLSTPQAYVNTDAQGVKHFPGFSVAAVQFLIRERDVWGVGVDTLSIDPGRDDQYRTHKALLGAGKWALEAVANLQQVPSTGATLFVGAPKVRDATGGPVRLIALRPMAAGLDTGQLHGTWRSPAPERIDRADGSAVFVSKQFTFDDSRWRIVFTVSSDASGKERLFSGDFSGPYELGEYLPLVEAYQGRFLFSQRTLTVHAPALLAAVVTGRCGNGEWILGTAKDVHVTGCAPLRIYPAAQCSGEFDLIRLGSQQIFLGKRPADGNLCSEDRRPQRLADLPVRKSND